MPMGLEWNWHMYSLLVTLYFKKNFFLAFIYFWDRDKAWTGEGQREGDTESETGSRLWAVSPEPDAGLELTDREIMTWAEVGRLTDWATQAPQDCIFYITLLLQYGPELEDWLCPLLISLLQIYPRT